MQAKPYFKGYNKCMLINGNPVDDVICENVKRTDFEKDKSEIEIFHVYDSFIDNKNRLEICETNDLLMTRDAHNRFIGKNKIKKEAIKDKECLRAVSLRLPEDMIEELVLELDIKKQHILKQNQSKGRWKGNLSDKIREIIKEYLDKERCKKQCKRNVNSATQQ